jgi:DNA-binding transcriptional ArsR family regulator
MKHDHKHIHIGAGSPLVAEEAAQGFAAVGSEARLQVVLALVRAGEPGLTVGAIQQRLGIPASTLAHHIRFLAAAGLIVQEKQGREIINQADFERISDLAHYLLSQCCADVAEDAS